VDLSSVAQKTVASRATIPSSPAAGLPLKTDLFGAPQAATGRLDNAKDAMMQF
jgi:hypothetical protein